jgi:exonuclease III
MSSLVFYVASWNVPGLGDDNKCTDVSADISLGRPNLIGLQESKLGPISKSKAAAFLPPSLQDFRAMDDVGSSGGLVSAWDQNIFGLVGTLPSRHILSLDLSFNCDGAMFRFSNVYAPCVREEKAAFFQDLASLEPSDDIPWISAGDFNMTRDPAERNNANFSIADDSLFNDSINSLALIELPLRDRQFMWSNNRGIPTLIRLDRVFINHSWNSRFPSSSLSSLTRNTSDHVPLIATISTSIPKRGSFRYEPSWALHHSFRSAISHAWTSTSHSDPTSQLVARLKMCRVSCKKWAKRKPSHLEQEKDCRLLINLLDILEEGRPLTFAENCLRSLAMDALHLAIRERSVYWKTRAEVRFALEGDENTKFFHASATCRLRRNSIPRLIVDGEECSSHPEKASVLKNYYSALLGTASVCTWRFDLSGLYPPVQPSRPPLATFSPLRRLKKPSRI